MEAATKELLNYGVLGIAVIGLATYIWLMQRRAERQDAQREQVAREERLEWQIITKDGNAATREHTNVLVGLKTLLETTRERKR